MKKKLLIAVAAMALIVACVVGGSLAYLFTETKSVENTFEYGDINIILDEADINDEDNDKDTTERVMSQSKYKMIPGNTLTKDPTVTVLKDSEACWLFVKVEKSANFDTFMTYDIDNQWKELESAAGTNFKVYYLEAPAATENTPYPVIENNQVTVKTTVTKELLNELTQATYPTLTFTAYAVQKANVADATTAWAIAQNDGLPANS